MRVKIDREADALYFRLGESRVVESEEIRSGVIVDYEEDGQTVGLELLDISKTNVSGTTLIDPFQQFVGGGGGQYG